jgi:hypothetical protein
MKVTQAQRQRFPSHPNSRDDTEIVMVRRGVNRPEFECCSHPNRQMETTVTGKQLAEQREALKAQIRWAMHHGGDEELLNLLRIESDRLSMKTGECPDPTPGAGLTCEKLRQARVAEEGETIMSTENRMASPSAVALSSRRQRFRGGGCSPLSAVLSLVRSRIPSSPPGQTPTWFSGLRTTT